MTEKPNIVFMLADNVGWGDLSCYGGLVPTPRFDQLAAESRYEGLRELDIPTLVLHGRSDPFIPIQHGQKCALDIIPGAEAVWVDGMGHDIPTAYNDIVVDSILANLARGP